MFLKPRPTRTVTVLEVERLEIQVEQLQKRQDSDRLTIRDLERDLAETRSTLDNTQKNLQASEKTITELTSKILDLKAQVREEIEKNNTLENRVTELLHFRDALSERDESITSLQKELEGRNTVLAHARQALRDEKDKAKSLSDELEKRQSLEEEMKIARSESLTLKRLLVAKDALVIRKSQELAAAMATKKSMQAQQESQRPHSVAATFPCGAIFVDPDKQMMTESERRAVMFDAQNEESSETTKQYRPRRTTSAIVDVGRVPLKAIHSNRSRKSSAPAAQKSTSVRITVTKQPSPRPICPDYSTAPYARDPNSETTVAINQSEPQNNRRSAPPRSRSSQSQGAFICSVQALDQSDSVNSSHIGCSEEEDDDPMYRDNTPPHLSPSHKKDNDDDNQGSKSSGERASSCKILVKRSDNVHGNGTRPPSATSNSSIESIDVRKESIQKREKPVLVQSSPRTNSSPSLLETILVSAHEHRPATTATGQRASRLSRSANSRRPKTAVVYPQHANPRLPRKLVNGDDINNNNISRKDGDGENGAEEGKDEPPLVDMTSFQRMLSIRDKDDICTHLVSLADRVVVDISKKKDRRSDLQGGLVKYIGPVDKPSAKKITYVGLKLDNPVGDNDGLYKGRRYFTVPANHGKMVKIRKIRYILDPQANSPNPYVPIKTRMEQFVESVAQELTNNHSSQKSKKQ